MTRYTNLLDNLVLLGVPTIEVDGWETNGSATFNPKGGVNHHTAGPLKGVIPSLGICINGRPDVPGPLANVVGGRDHVARLISAGRANHAGRGGFRGLTGNSSVFGLEMEHCGYGDREPVTPDDFEFMARIQAAFAITGGYGADMVCQHWEWTTRKIDFVKSHFDPNTFRARVADLIIIAKQGTTPTPPREDDDMTPEEHQMLVKALAAAEEARGEAHAAGVRAQSLEESIKRIEFTLGTGDPDAATTGTMLPRLIKWATRTEKLNKAMATKLGVDPDA